jgi:hypothetical protein
MGTEMLRRLRHTVESMLIQNGMGIFILEHFIGMPLS